MLNKNTILDLWSALGDTPTNTVEGIVVIDEPFISWQAGTPVETIWRWFDDQFADYGGVHVLMYDNPQPERKFQVVTPGGVIECYSKHEGVDSGEDFPGVYVDIRRNQAQLEGKEIGDMACCVEYDSCSKHLQTVVYQLLQDEPTHVEVYEPLMTYGEFLEKYSDEIIALEIFDTEGNEVPDDLDIPDDTPVIRLSRLSGSFTLDIDLLRAKTKASVDKLPERISIDDVRRGLTDGDIVLVEREGCVVAQIGEHWFYFGGNECEGVTASMHIDTTYFEDDVQDIYEALNAYPINGLTDDQSTECLYYKAFLEESFAKRDALFKGKEVAYPIEDQIEACYDYLNWTDRKDPHEMTEDELLAAEQELADCEPGFSWVKRAGYIQAIPQDKRSGSVILTSGPGM